MILCVCLMVGWFVFQGTTLGLLWSFTLPAVWDTTSCRSTCLPALSSLYHGCHSGCPGNHTLLFTGNYSRLACQFYFVRSLGYYVIQIYVPSCLIVVLSWVSFWLSRYHARSLSVFFFFIILHVSLDHIIQMCSGITRGRVLDGELYAQRFQMLSALTYRLFHEDVSSIIGTKTVLLCICPGDWGEIFMKQSVNKYR